MTKESASTSKDHDSFVMKIRNGSHNGRRIHTEENSKAEGYIRNNCETQSTHCRNKYTHQIIHFFPIEKHVTCDTGAKQPHT